jgi:uncharacterized protein (TIGR03066 family)
MKKVLFALLAVTILLASSCSKEKKINKRLDGIWKMVSYEGEAIPSEEQVTYTFTKDEKDNGTGSVSFDEDGVSIPFTYTISEDKVTVTITFMGESNTEVLTITKYKKDRIEWTESDGKKAVLDPK